MHKFTYIGSSEVKFQLPNSNIIYIPNGLNSNVKPKERDVLIMTSSESFKYLLDNDACYIYALEIEEGYFISEYDGILKSYGISSGKYSIFTSKGTILVVKEEDEDDNL